MPLKLGSAHSIGDRRAGSADEEPRRAAAEFDTTAALGNVRRQPELATSCAAAPSGRVPRAPDHPYSPTGC
jgi:hypothetical protein